MTNISQLGLFGILLLFVSIGPVQCRICTRTSAEKRVQTEKYPGTCHQTYNARCGWFSIKQCTFNETITCLKERNRTVTLYRIIEDCCPGYHRNRDGKCISEAEMEVMSTEKTEQDTYHTTQEPSDLEVESSLVTVAFNKSVEGQGYEVEHSQKDTGSVEGSSPAGQRGEEDHIIVNMTYHKTKGMGQGVRASLEEKGGQKKDAPEPTGGEDQVAITSPPPVQVNAHSETGVQHGDSYDDDDKFFLGISHGAYAGIICGILFICCIALLTALHYRKRRLMKAKKDCVMAETDASQKQQMIPLERTGSPTPTA